jgi:hypothetical protein
VAVTVDDSAAALDFDQEDAGAGDHEGVDLVHGAVVGDELEVSLEERGVAVGKRLGQALHSFPLVRILRLGKPLPSCFRESHKGP